MQCTARLWFQLARNHIAAYRTHLTYDPLRASAMRGLAAGFSRSLKSCGGIGVVCF